MLCNNCVFYSTENLPQFSEGTGKRNFNIHNGADRDIGGVIRMFKTKRKSRRKNKFKYQDNQLPCKETMDFLSKCTKFDEEEIAEWYRCGVQIFSFLFQSSAYLSLQSF